MKKHEGKIIFWAVVMCASFIVGVVFAFAGHLHNERWYQDRWCGEAAGETEVVLEGRVRCDCVTETHAIEFDFARKWYEAVGQALHYGRLTGKRPGIVLIIEQSKDEIYLNRLKLVINYYSLPIDVWQVSP